MAEKKEKLYLELQMEELKAAHADAIEDNSAPKKSTKDNSKNAEIAKMYEDAAEYEEDLKGFESYFEIDNTNALKDIDAALIKSFPNEQKYYSQ